MGSDQNPYLPRHLDKTIPSGQAKATGAEGDGGGGEVKGEDETWLIGR